MIWLPFSAVPPRLTGPKDPFASERRVLNVSAICFFKVFLGLDADLIIRDDVQTYNEAPMYQ